jgi:hypothetical protein
MLPAKHPRLAALIAGLAMFAVPAQTQACWLFGHHHRTTFYAPLAVAAPACHTCAPQTVGFAPQVAFRPLFTTTPVTAFRPVTTVDPCTSCPTTAMHPTTAFMQRTVMLPYTTFRPVMQTSFFAPRPAFAAAIAPAACPGGMCGSAATTTFYQPSGVAPVISAPAPVISQPGCCGNTAPPVTYGTPMSSTTSAPSLGMAPLYASPNTIAPRTFNNTSDSPSDVKNNTIQPALKPIPMPDGQIEGTKDDSTSLPRLLDPQNHTTATTPARSYIPVALNYGKSSSGTARPSTRLDDSGWEAAR